MRKKEILKRFITLVAGLFIVAFGVALSVKAHLGVSPISCVPYVYSVGFPLTMGAATIILNVVLVLLQILLRRKKYQPVQLLQLPVAVMFGFFTDFTLYLVDGIQVTDYWLQLALCISSCAVIAFGVFLEVKAKLTYLAGEGLSLAISETFQVEFGKAKIAVDSTLVVVGIMSSVIFLRDLQGVREGTIAAALLVGSFSRLYSKKFTFIDTFLAESKAMAQPLVTESGANEKFVITISREFGSGGHEIGKLVAEKIGCAFYDKALITLSAEAGGFTTEYIKAHEQKLANTLLYNLYEQNYAYINEQIPPLDALFLVQSKIIRSICEKESCVIVGRCANFVLKNNTNCFNVFIHAHHTYRRERIIDQYGVTPHIAEKEMERTDREKNNYCKHYTGKIWEDVRNYDLAIDSSLFGTEEAAHLIIEAAYKITGKAVPV